jgi:hypothetical protein
VIRTTVFDQIQNEYLATPWPFPFDSVGALQNDTTIKWHQGGTPPPHNNLKAALRRRNNLSKGGEPLVAAEYRYRASVDDPSKCCVHAGEGVGDIDRVDEPAKELVERAEAEALEAIGRLTAISSGYHWAPQPELSS